MTLPYIKILGDRALGLGYHRLFTHSERGYQLFRLSVSRWEWVRTSEGWKTSRRVHRLVDEESGGQVLLKNTLREIRTGEFCFA